MSFTDLINQRYSVRKYDTRPIEAEKLQKILEAGRQAPTACNYQPQRILVVQDADLQKINDCREVCNHTICNQNAQCRKSYYT